MGKKELVILDSKEAYRQAAKTLSAATRVAKARGSGEELANIALTWMELASRMSDSSEEQKSENKKVGFHHDE